MGHINIAEDFDCVEDQDTLETAKRVAIGIADAIKHGGMYRKGYRNSIAVDWSCACYCLGVDADDAAEQLELTSDELANMKARCETISGYLGTWAQDADGVFAYMIDPGEWESQYENHYDHALMIHTKA